MVKFNCNKYDSLIMVDRVLGSVHADTYRKDNVTTQRPPKVIPRMLCIVGVKWWYKTLQESVLTLVERDERDSHTSCSQCAGAKSVWTV
jgi:hypothetical protein